MTEDKNDIGEANFIIECEEILDSYINGNITAFKKWLGEQNSEGIFRFIKWLQDGGYKI